MMGFYARLEESDLRQRFVYFSEQVSRAQTSQCREDVSLIAAIIFQNFLKMPCKIGKDQDFICLVADGQDKAADAMLNAAHSKKWLRFGSFTPSAQTLAQAFNKCGMSALHYTALDGNVGLSACLIAAGSMCDALNLMLETPLMLAAESGHADLVAGLLMAGADPAAQDIFGQTALMRACQKGHLTASYALLGKRSPLLISVQDVFGYDALDYAIEARCHPLVEVLSNQLSDGSSKVLQRARTKTPLQLEYV